MYGKFKKSTSHHIWSVCKTKGQWQNSRNWTDPQKTGQNGLFQGRHEKVDLSMYRNRNTASGGTSYGRSWRNKNLL